MHIERLRGTGTAIVAGESRIPVQYNIRLAKPEFGLGELTGTVWSATDPWFALRHFREVMTLEMNDGRSFKFFHTHSKTHSIALNEWIGRFPR